MVLVLVGVEVLKRLGILREVVVVATVLKMHENKRSSVLLVMKTKRVIACVERWGWIVQWCGG